MLSAGNDIVDLGNINIARTVNPNFYSKFITGTEIALHQPHQLPLHHFVWMLWSVKESVYKFVQRHQPGLVFSPSKILVQYIDNPLGFSGMPSAQSITQGKGFENHVTCNSAVSFGHGNFYACSIINSNYILTVINDTNKFDNIYWGVKLIDSDAPDDQSAMVRQFAMARLDEVAGDNMVIQKSTAGIPHASNQNGRLNIPLSLSHHGYYVTYAFCMAQR